MKKYRVFQGFQGTLKKQFFPVHPNETIDQHLQRHRQVTVKHPNLGVFALVHLCGNVHWINVELSLVARPRPGTSARRDENSNPAGHNHGSAVLGGRASIFLPLRQNFEENGTHQRHVAGSVCLGCSICVVFGDREPLVLHTH